MGGWLDLQNSTKGLEVLSRELSKNDNIYSRSRTIKKLSHFQKFGYYTPNDVTAELDNIKIHKTVSPKKNVETRNLG